MVRRRPVRTRRPIARRVVEAQTLVDLPAWERFQPGYIDQCLWVASGKPDNRGVLRGGEGAQSEEQAAGGRGRRQETGAGQWEGRAGG
jgi:hypothetical protein